MNSCPLFCPEREWTGDKDRKSTRLNSSHLVISYAVFCLKKKNKNQHIIEIKPLTSARTIKSKLPLTFAAPTLVVETRDAIRPILHVQHREPLIVIDVHCP